MVFNKRKKIAIGILICLLVLNILAWSAVYDLNKTGYLEVVFFDVGQGDAALIKSAEGHYILIDGGPDSKIMERLSKEIPAWQKSIDLVILTHPHGDHFAGLIDVIQGYRVDKFLWSGVFEESSAFKKLEDLIFESETETITAWAGKRIRGNNFFIDVLYPFFSLEGEEFKDLNLASLVLRLVFNNNTFLFMGDAYKSTERQLVEKEIFCQESSDIVCEIIILKSDVLKVSHHGSKTSTAEEFVAVVSPEIAVISAGKDNRHGHPHFETLDTLEKYGISIFRTDMEGNIKILSDGENLKVKN